MGKIIKEVKPKTQLFNLSWNDDQWLHRVLEESFQEMDEYFDRRWVNNRPQLFILKDRKTINELRNETTNSWVIGFGGGKSGKMYVLDKEGFERESSHKYSQESYALTIKHELTHCYVDLLIGNYRNPVWLNEGFVCNVNREYEHFKKPQEFQHFLSCFDNHGKGAYDEGTWFVKMLLDQFGKKKMIEFHKQLKAKLNEKEFNQLFEKVYGFKLEYGDVNKKWKQYQEVK